MELYPIQFFLIFLSILNLLILIILVLVAIAFFTLIERKILGLRQRRKGPNKVAFLGLLQPFADAIKLFSKEMTFMSYSNKVLFFFSPIFSLFLILSLWATIPFFRLFISIQFRFILLLTILRIGLYPLLVSGWSSNSKYALLGRLRGGAQTISYEISLALLLLSVLVLGKRTSIFALVNNKMTIYLFFILLPVMVLWLISCVAETNRTPFDFSEGESELVSGFNVEYASFGFALIFMAEYGIILFFSIITAGMFFFGTHGVSTVLIAIVVRFWWIWLRATYPRYRYDKLINLAWKGFLPLSLGLVIFFIRVIWVSGRLVHWT
jgi:NADH-ubiquinone oxidoreductase chain 1